MGLYRSDRGWRVAIRHGGASIEIATGDHGKAEPAWLRNVVADWAAKVVSPKDDEADLRKLAGILGINVAKAKSARGVCSAIKRGRVKFDDTGNLTAPQPIPPTRTDLPSSPAASSPEAGGGSSGG